MDLSNPFPSQLMASDTANSVQIKPETDSDYNSDVSGLLSTEDIQNACGQSASDAEDLLRNGILVETNKGVVCMSLKDVLSTNANLSADDFKLVANQLLSHEDVLPQNETEEVSSSSLKTSKSPSYTVSTELKDFITNSDFDSTCDDLNQPSTSSVLLKNFQNNEILLNSRYKFKSMLEPLQSTSTATSEAVDTSEETDKEKNSSVVQKRRGGWPKGRKRKPELLNLPPKAPKTSYNIFLKERRKLYKDKLAFHEITRVVGNQWSNLTLEEKQPYIERAEEDKKRYREELMVYRRSDAYKLHLARKRKKRGLDNLMSESDMDGTDDVDDEDDNMLYCDSCDQWFYNLHNKREHLQSRQHQISMNKHLASSDNENKGNISSVSFSTSLDESSMDAPSTYPFPAKKNVAKGDNVHENMIRLIRSVAKREKEIDVLRSRLEDAKTLQSNFVTELNLQKHKCRMLQFNLANEIGRAHV